jgi:hypothetical protein
MAKHFLTGMAQSVTDSVKRVTALTKDRPIPGAKPKAGEPARKDFGKRTYAKR